MSPSLPSYFKFLQLLKTCLLTTPDGSGILPHPDQKTNTKDGCEFLFSSPSQRISNDFTFVWGAHGGMGGWPKAIKCKCTRCGDAIIIIIVIIAIQRLHLIYFYIKGQKKLIAFKGIMWQSRRRLKSIVCVV